MGKTTEKSTLHIIVSPVVYGLHGNLFILRSAWV